MGSAYWDLLPRSSPPPRRIAWRVRVQEDLAVPGHPDIFVVGDTASLDQVASRCLAWRRWRCNMAVVGKGFAVLQSGRVHVSGFLAWLAWAAVHLEFLAQSILRVSVFMQWVWTYLTGQRGSRLIVDHRGSEPVKTAEAPGLVRMEK
jgi:NADH dehydrogenase